MDERVFLRKFGPEAKQIITTVSPGEKKPVKILIRISGDLDTRQQMQLQELGCQIRTTAGNVVTAEVPEGALLQVGELDFISYLEIAQPLFPEAKANQKSSKEVENGSD